MNLSDDQLLAKLELEFECERKSSTKILLYLKEVEVRKLYADRGYSSLFEMLLKQFRQSATAAWQRVKAVELMSAVPKIEKYFLSGDLNLSTLAMAQRQIQQEENETGEVVSQELKTEIIDKICGKTMAEAGVELMRLLPNSAKNPRAKRQRVSATETRIHLTFPDEILAKLERLKDLWAHANPDMDFVEIIDRAANIALDKVDPLRKRPRRNTETEVKPAGQRPTYYSVQTDKTLCERAQAQCEFVDDQTGRGCECRFGLERDHIIPLVLGGSNELSNLRLLCKAHNLHVARRHFGFGRVRDPATL